MRLRGANNSAREVWDVSGFAWSDAAGWMTLSGMEYYPDSTTLSGWLWSDTVGWTVFTSGDIIVNNV